MKIKIIFTELRSCKLSQFGQLFTLKDMAFA